MISNSVEVAKQRHERRCEEVERKRKIEQDIKSQKAAQTVQCFFQLPDRKLVFLVFILETKGIRAYSKEIKKVKNRKNKINR